MGLTSLSSFLTASTIVFFMCLFRLWKFAKYGLMDLPEVNWPKTPLITEVMQTFLDHRIYPLIELFPLILLVELIVKQLFTWED